MFRVSTAYKTKANKVQPVDSSKTDSSKPGGSLDWFEKSKLDNVPCLDLGQYPDWIISKFSNILKGSRLTKERIERLVVGDSLWSKEKELFIEMLYNWEKALAFDFTYIEKIRPRGSARTELLPALTAFPNRQSDATWKVNFECIFN
jgi:hypothetical protein